MGNDKYSKRYLYLLKEQCLLTELNIFPTNNNNNNNNNNDNNNSKNNIINNNNGDNNNNNFLIILILTIIHFVENQSVDTKVIKNKKILYTNYNNFIVHLH